MTSKGITGGLVLLAVIAVAPAAHGQQQADGSAPVADDSGPQTEMPVPDLPEEYRVTDPPVRLTRPNWAFLTGQEIEALFSDTALIIDIEYEVAPGIKPTILLEGGCPPVESFSADGCWTKAVCHRVMRVFEGRWTTESVGGGDRLCVEACDFPLEEGRVSKVYALI